MRFEAERTRWMCGSCTDAESLQVYAAVEHMVAWCVSGGALRGGSSATAGGTSKGTAGPKAKGKGKSSAKVIPQPRSQTSLPVLIPVAKQKCSLHQLVSFFPAAFRVFQLPCLSQCAFAI